MINLIELLPKEEIEAFRDYGQETDGVCPDTLTNEVLFGPWNEAKQKLYHLLGDNFIIHQPVEFAVSKALLEREILNKVLLQDDYNYHPIPKAFIQIIENEFLDYHFHDGARYLIGSQLRNIISETQLATNAWPYDTTVIPAEYTPNHKPFKIQQGMKLIKLIEKILKLYDKYDAEEFEKFRIAHSLCLNEKTTKGELHLSIHPLDYATMSDNNCGWDSCMIWGSGEYHQGTVEMMNSPYMVVAYLTSSKPFILSGTDDFEWTNKKWRKLYIVSPAMLMGIKAYPYAAEQLDLIVLDWLKELAEINMGWKYLDQPQKIDNYSTHIINVGGIDYKLYVDLYMKHMYKDIYKEHWGYFTSDDAWWDENKTLTMCLSGASECLTCGRIGAEHLEHAYLECHECGDFSQCPVCENWYSNEDEWYDIHGEYVCSCCADDYPACESCGGLAIEECYAEFYSSKDPVEYHRYCAYFCAGCMKEVFETNKTHFSVDITTLDKEQMENYINNMTDAWTINKLTEMWNQTFPDNLLPI